MKIYKISDLINEKFISFPVNNIVYNLWNDVDTQKMILDKNVKELNRFLKNIKSNNYDMPSITFYHGTSANYNILNDGLLVTNSKRAKSLSSTAGYVYLSIYPESAQTFAELGNPYGDLVIYEVTVPANKILPDTDQTFLKRRESDSTHGDTLADSIIFGNGVRVKGDIPPYMIKEYKKIKR